MNPNQSTSIESKKMKTKMRNEQSKSIKFCENQNQWKSMKSNLKESKALKIYQNQWFWGRIQNFLWICLPESKVIEINQNQHESKAFKKFIKKNQNQSTKMNQNQSHSIKFKAKEFKWIRPNQNLPSSTKINQNQSQ